MTIYSIGLFTIAIKSN